MRLWRAGARWNFSTSRLPILRDLTLYDGKTGLKIPEGSAEALFV